MWVWLFTVKPPIKAKGASTALPSNKEMFFMLEKEALQYDALFLISCGGSTDTPEIRFVKYCAIVMATAKCENVSNGYFF